MTASTNSDCNDRVGDSEGAADGTLVGPADGVVVGAEVVGSELGTLLGA